ncbi:MarR family winged helix-turn-helix transcriptional regulator [Konateibacter massiliensis]|uniref:MarR family winged helix-turn-helix transcriptional regulator n=1 Tax=Konateibacter massiliensis TaxID=2002841 RepID=UPI000C14AD86|nr:MarR family transcriptional regulator [Konateibacter massiliensis]
MQTEPTNFIMLNAKIYRNTQGYLDRALKKFDLSSGSFRYLFILEKSEGICQNRLSEKIGNDKAMSTRTIAKLMELGYVVRQSDERDSRAYKLYLTDKARSIIPGIRKEIAIMVDLLTEDLTEEERRITERTLNKIFNKTLDLNT